MFVPWANSNSVLIWNLWAWNAGYIWSALIRQILFWKRSLDNLVAILDLVQAALFETVSSPPFKLILLKQRVYKSSKLLEIVFAVNSVTNGTWDVFTTAVCKCVHTEWTPYTSESTIYITFLNMHFSSNGISTFQYDGLEKSQFDWNNLLWSFVKSVRPVRKDTQLKFLPFSFIIWYKLYWEVIPFQKYSCTLKCLLDTIS